MNPPIPRKPLVEKKTRTYSFRTTEDIHGRLTRLMRLLHAHSQSHAAALLVDWALPIVEQAIKEREARGETPERQRL